MTDPREALVDGERVAYGEAWDALVPEVGRTVGQIVTSTIDAILAAGWTPPGEGEWEYSIAYPDECEDGSVRWNTGGVEPMCSREGAERDLATGDYLASDRVVRRRKAGPWEVVEDD